MFVGGIFTLLIPAAAHVKLHLHSTWGSMLLVYIAAFLFFLFSTPPKIGFATLLQVRSVPSTCVGVCVGRDFEWLRVWMKRLRYVIAVAIGSTDP